MRRSWVQDDVRVGPCRDYPTVSGLATAIRDTVLVETRPPASLITAFICGVLYPLLASLSLALTDDFAGSVRSDFAGWAIRLAPAMLLGTLLAFVGTYFGLGRTSRPSATRTR